MALDFYKGSPGTTAVAILSALVAAWACPLGGKNDPLDDPDFPFSTDDVVGMISDAPTDPEIQIEYNALDPTLETEVGGIRFVVTNLRLCDKPDALNQVSGTTVKGGKSVELHASRGCGTVYRHGEGKFRTLKGPDARRILTATEYAAKAGGE